ncbi:hypothetical protein L4D77_14230 [Photobacterium frigidiphilum]|uniref:condensin complex protein MksE n=1 Tax=Photobacterium frigidiphilum TaxID=264736 RepID=UPI003D0B6CE3
MTNEHQRFSSFDLVSTKDSRNVYKAFQAGKVITKFLFNNGTGSCTESHLYQSLFNHLDHYTTLYCHIGSELVFEPEGDFFYIRGLDLDEDESNATALKIQATLILLGSIFTRRGFNLEHLSSIQYGIDDNDLIYLKAQSESLDILKACKLENWEDALSFLVKRNIAFYNHHNNLILTSAGQYFLNKLVDSYNSRPEDERPVG